MGVLLYEMLVGIPPYYSNNKDQLYDNIGKLVDKGTITSELVPRNHKGYLPFHT